MKPVLRNKVFLFCLFVCIVYCMSNAVWAAGDVFRATVYVSLRSAIPLKIHLWLQTLMNRKSMHVIMILKFSK